MIPSGLEYQVRGITSGKTSSIVVRNGKNRSGFMTKRVTTTCSLRPPRLTWISVNRRSRWMNDYSPIFREATMSKPVSYTHLRAHETRHDLVCRLLLEKKKK